MLQMSTFCHLINEFLFIFSSERHEKDIVSNKREPKKEKKSHNDSFLYFFHSSLVDIATCRLIKNKKNKKKKLEKELESRSLLTIFSL